MPHIPGSVPVTGFIAPTDSTDAYATIDPTYGIDGMRSVIDHSARNAIPTPRRRQGMMVYTQNDGQYWGLVASPWAGTDADWSLLAVAAGGAQGSQGYQGRQGSQGAQGVQGNSALVAMGATVTSGTPGSVLYLDGSGNLAQDNAAFSYSTSTGLTASKLDVQTVSPLQPPTWLCYGGHGPLTFRGGDAMGGTVRYENVTSAQAIMTVQMDEAAQVVVGGATTGTTPLVVKGASAQTANLTQWRNSGGTVLASVAADGSGLFTGTSVFRKPGGTPGTDELQLSNTGSESIVETKSSGYLRFIGPYGTIYQFTSAGSRLDFNGIYSPETAKIYISQDLIRLGYDSSLAWTNAAAYQAATVAITSPSAGLLKMTDGSTGNGSLILGSYTTSTVALTIKAVASQTAALTAFQGISSTSTVRDLGYVDAVFVVSTDASHTGRVTLSAADYTTSHTGRQEGLRVESDGTQAKLGFYGHAAAAKPSGDIGTALTSLGLMTSPTVAATVSGGTSGRIPYETSGGVLTDSAALSFDGTNLVVLTGVAGASPAVFRQTDGTAGMHELQVSHNGTKTTVESKSGSLTLKSGSISLDIGTGGFTSSFAGAGIQLPSLTESALGLWQINNTGSGEFRLGQAVLLWGPSAAYNVTMDAGIARSTIGVLKLTDGSSGYGSLILGSYTTSTVALTIKAVASQTAALTAFQGISSTSTARDLGYVDAVFAVSTDASHTGRVTISAADYTSSHTGRQEGLRIESDGTYGLSAFGGVVLATTRTTVYTGAAGNTGLVVKGASSQSANLQEWQNNSGTALALVAPSGRIEAAEVAVAGNLTALGIVKANYVSDSANTIAYVTTATDSTHAWTLTTRSTSKVPFSVQGASGQTANLQEWQDSVGVSRFAILPDGTGFFGRHDTANAGKMRLSNYYGDGGGNLTYWSYNGALSGVWTQDDVATASVVTTMGTFSGWTNPGVLWSYIPAGSSTLTGTFGYSGADGTVRLGSVSDPGIAGTAQLAVQATSSSRKVLIVKGASSQSANLQEWQDNGGTPLASVISTGTIKASGNTSLGVVPVFTSFGGLWVGASGTQDITNATVISDGSDTYFKYFSTMFFRDASNVATVCFTPYRSVFGVFVGGSSGDSNANVSIMPNNTTTRALTVRAVASQTAPLTAFQGISSTSTARDLGYVDAVFVVDTDASHTGRLTLSAADYTTSHTGRQEGLRVESDGTQAKLGFYGHAAAAKPSGDIGTALTGLGLMTSPTVAATVSGGTSGRIPYETSGGLLTDSANLTWDSVNKDLGLGASGDSYVTGLAAVHVRAMQGYVDLYSWGAVVAHFEIRNSYVVAYDTGYSALQLRGVASQTAPLLPLQGVSSNATVRDLGYVDAAFVVATDATHTGRVTLSAADYTSSHTGRREGFRVESDGTQAKLGFYGATAVAKPSGDIGTALVDLGLITSPTGGGSGDRFSTLSSSPVAITGTTSLSGSAFGKLHVCSGTSANYTVSLPDPTSHAGESIGFRMAPGLTKFVTVSRNASETIDGANSRVMWALETAEIVTDGTNWFKLSGRSRALTAQSCASAGQGVTGSLTVTTLNLDTSLLDPSGAIVNIVDYKLEIPRTSTYLAGIAVRWANLPADIVRIVAGMKINGTTPYAVGGETSALTGAYPSFDGSQPVALTAADYLTTVGFHNHSGTVNTYGDGSVTGCAMSIVEIPQW